MKNVITRSIVNGHFSYTNKNGQITNQNEIDRINKLRIPPAWTNVVINSDKNHDLLATGIDKSGKTQYIYNQKFIEENANRKFIRLGIFITVKNKITNFINSNKDYSSKNFIPALLFEILFITSIRIGNDIYNTYGLSNLEKRHIVFKSDGVYLKFVGKKSIKQSIHIPTKHSRVISALHFLYNKRSTRIFGQITPVYLNNTLRDITGEDITCKDFRTYGANRLFITNVQKGIPVAEAIKIVAKELGNGSDICKKSYIIPELIHIPISSESPDIIILNTIRSIFRENSINII